MEGAEEAEGTREAVVGALHPDSAAARGRRTHGPLRCVPPELPNHFYLLDSFKASLPHLHHPGLIPVSVASVLKSPHLLSSSPICSPRDGHCQLFTTNQIVPLPRGDPRGASAASSRCPSPPRQLPADGKAQPQVSFCTTAIHCLLACTINWNHVLF